MAPSDAFYDALATRESKNNPQSVNEFGFMGLYQMGPAALRDIKYMDENQTWIGKNVINSRQDFLNNPRVQNQAIREYHNLVWNNYLTPLVKGAVGRTIGGIDVTRSGIVAAAHLVGQGGITDFISSNGNIDRRDEIGTPCSEYLRQFGGYD